MSGQIQIHDVEGDRLVFRQFSNINTQQVFYMTDIALPELTTSQHQLTVEEQDFIIRIKSGWNMLGFPFDLSTVTRIETFNTVSTFVDYPNLPQHIVIPTLQPITHYVNTNTGQVNIVADSGNHATYSNTGYHAIDTHNTITVTDLFAGVHSAGNMIIAKDYLGNAYLPDFNFDGVGGVHRFEGIQYKTHTGTDMILKIRAKRNHRILTVNGVDMIQFGSYFGIGKGWQLINNPFYHEVYESANPPFHTDIRSVEDVFQIFVEDIIIAKINSGSAYLPAWNFNCIGDFRAYEAYQLKTVDNTYHSFFVADL